MAEQWMPKDKPELMSEIEKEWKLLINVAEKLTPIQMTTPDAGGWSPKDNLAHLAVWVKILMESHLDHRPSHEVLGISEDVAADIEASNTIVFDRNRDRSSQDILDELKQVYGQLMARLETMTFDDMMKPRHTDDPEKRPLVLWILGDTTEHFAEHRETIEKMMG